MQTAPEKRVVAVEQPKPDRAHLFARFSMAASLNAAGVIQAYLDNVLTDPSIDAGDVVPLCDELRGTFRAVNSGDLAQMEAMLVGQAVALQTMFTSLARRAKAQTSQKMFESVLHLAFKAQAQSRATISALVDLKYPRQATFVKQANIANGAQQINNGQQPPHAHGETRGSEQSKLLEDLSHGGTYVDIGTAGATGGGNPAMEAVDQVNRPANRRRKGKG